MSGLYKRALSAEFHCTDPNGMAACILLHRFRRRPLPKQTPTAPTSDLIIVEEWDLNEGMSVTNAANCYFEAARRLLGVDWNDITWIETHPWPDGRTWARVRFWPDRESRYGWKSVWHYREEPQIEELIGCRYHEIPPPTSVIHEVV